MIQNKDVLIWLIVSLAAVAITGIIVWGAKT